MVPTCSNSKELLWFNQNSPGGGFLGAGWGFKTWDNFLSKVGEFPPFPFSSFSRVPGGFPLKGPPPPLKVGSAFFHTSRLNFSGWGAIGPLQWGGGPPVGGRKLYHGMGSGLFVGIQHGVGVRVPPVWWGVCGAHPGFLGRPLSKRVCGRGSHQRG